MPIAISQDVDSTGVDATSGADAHALAAQIVRDQQPVINRFVAKQRQQVEIGGLEVHRAELALPGMDVYYRNMQGLEQMHYHVSPQAEGRQPTPEPIEPPEVPKPPTPEEPVPPPIPEPPKPPEVPEPPKPPEIPKPPEPEKPKEPEPEKEKEKEHENPDFLTIDVPCFLAVEFGDKAGPEPQPKK